jgi:hypothetical protein
MCVAVAAAAAGSAFQRQQEHWKEHWQEQQHDYCSVTQNVTQCNPRCTAPGDSSMKIVGSSHEEDDHTIPHVLGFVFA